MLNLTPIKAIDFDVKRELFFGKTAQLVLLDYEQGATGETALLTIVDGWFLSQQKDTETSTVKVEVTDRIEITEQIMQSVKRFSVINVSGIPSRAYRVVPGGVTPPLEQPRLWQIQGEELRDQ